MRFHEFYNISVVAAHKPQICAQTFWPSSHKQDIREIFQSKKFPDSFSCGTHTSEIMSLVNHKEGIVFFGNFLQLHQVGVVRIHWKKPFCYHQNTLFRVLFSYLFKFLLHTCVTQMLYFVNVFRGSAGTF